MIIYFVRHLKTKGNYEKRYIGRTDEDVCQEEPQKVEGDLPVSPGKIFVSPMKRCIQTAEMIYPKRSQILVDNLREMDFGIFENKTYDELKENENYRKFIDGIESPVNGESKEAFKERCCGAFEHIIEECKPEDAVVVVCHGGTIMSIMEQFEKGHRGFYDYQIGNGQVLSCKYDDGVLHILGRREWN